jgi:hypothetical protein
VELSEADMTFYPEPHNARAVVRDSDEHVLLVHAIAQTLICNSVEGASLRDLDQLSPYSVEAAHLMRLRLSCRRSRQCDSPLCVMSPSGGVKLTNAALQCDSTCSGCHVHPPSLWRAQVAVLRLERAQALFHRASCGPLFGPPGPATVAIRFVGLDQHREYPHTLDASPGLHTTLPRPRRPGECRLVGYQRFEPLHERGEAVPRLI